MYCEYLLITDRRDYFLVYHCQWNERMAHCAKRRSGPPLLVPQQPTELFAKNLERERGSGNMEQRPHLPSGSFSAD